MTRQGSSTVLRRPSRSELVWALGISIALAFALFGSTIGGDFTLDDHSVIENRGELKSLANVPKFWLMSWHPNGEFAGNYRPLTMVSYAFNYVFSDSPAGFHIVNILIHAVNAVLVYLLAYVLATRRAAILAAALFMILPIHVEPIASIAGRNGLLGTLFFLSALLLLLKRRYTWSSLFFLAALFSADGTIAFLPLAGVVLLVEYRNFWKSLKTGLWYVPPLAIYFLFRYLALGKYAFGGYGFVDPIIGPLAFVSLKERVLTGFVHLYLYFQKTFIPHNLSPDYSFNQIPIVSGWFDSWLAWVGIALVAAAVVVFFRGSRNIKIATALFWIPMAVISNIFFITTGTMGERWWYLPSIGLMIMAALGIDWLLRRFRQFRYPLAGIAVFAAIWFVTVIWHQNNVWASDAVLFRTAASRSPQSAWARTNLAAQYFAEQRIEEARQEINAATAISNNNPLTLYLLGKLSWHDGKHGEAEQVWLRAVSFDAHDRNKRSLYRTLALLELDRGDNRKAKEYLEEALKYEPRGDTETVLKIDAYLVELIERYQNREARTYTQDEINEIGSVIKALRGF